MTDMTNRSISVDSEFSSGTVRSRIVVSKDLRKYFRRLSFYSSYDGEIAASKGILNIPVLSIVLPLAWVTGADIYVDELDKAFADSMDVLQLEYQKIYPNAPFKTNLVVNNLTESADSPDNTALLFSGGLDSIYSLYSNMTLKPRLIMIFGTRDIPISHVGFQERIRAEYTDFAKRENVDINFVRTNALELMDHNRMLHLWAKFEGKHEGDFWNGIGFSLGQIGQAAPLSIGRFNHLLISAACRNEAEFKREHPNASSPETDEKIAWANLRVKHDGHLHRYEKAASLKELLNNNRIKLRVCWSEPEFLFQHGLMNCGKCEKCLRTIASLAHVGIDPNNCGFDVDGSTFESMKYLLEGKLLTQNSIKAWWKPLQLATPDEEELDVCGSKHFFEWFKKANLDLMGRQHRTLLESAYFKLPYFMSNCGRRVYRSIFPNRNDIRAVLSSREARSCSKTQDPATKSSN